MSSQVQLGEKIGEGVGAGIDIFTLGVKKPKYVGHLGFHEQGDWQVNDSSQLKKYGWKRYAEPALKLARERYPRG